MAQQTGGDRLDRMENIVEGLLAAHILLEHSQNNLLKAQVLLQTEQQVKQLAESHQALAEAQKRTEQSLKEFIDHLWGEGPGRN